MADYIDFDDIYYMIVWGKKKCYGDVPLQNIWNNEREREEEKKNIVLM